MSKNKQSQKETLDSMLAEFSNLKAYGDAIRQQIEIAGSYITEMMLCKSTMEEINAREGTGEVMVHIGAGNYVKVQLLDVKTALMRIGAGVSAEKSITDAMSDLDAKIKNGQEQSVALQNQYLKITQRLGQLQGQVDKLYAQLEAAGQA